MGSSVGIGNAQSRWNYSLRLVSYWNCYSVLCSNCCRNFDGLLVMSDSRDHDLEEWSF